MHIPAYTLSTSSLLNAKAQALLEREANENELLAKLCPFTQTTLANPQQTIALRRCYERHYYGQLMARQRACYSVVIEPTTIAGVPVEIFAPSEGVPSVHRARVLINLHGGAFIMGARLIGQIESIPIAAMGAIKVISVDYRLAPEHRFPAAGEDVANVYRALLAEYGAQSIGIYGCSAGALLTAQTLAWLQREGLPRPAAVGMFGAAAAYWAEGDSGQIHAARSGLPLDQVIDPRQNPYFKDTDPNDPLAFPLRAPEILAQFPPSILASATRDLALSSVVQTHSSLVHLGVKADLHVWEGLDHAFHYFPELPQSAQLYRAAAKFFHTHLGNHQ